MSDHSPGERPGTSFPVIPVYPNRRKGRLRRLLPFLALLVAAWIVWFAADFAYVTLGAEVDHTARADVIIVLGCRALNDNIPSDCIRDRPVHAAQLYNEGLAPNLIVTGGETTPGATEAAIMAGELEAAGVPAGRIVRENRAMDTIQNIEYSRRIMLERGWRNAILVTEPYHIKRAALIARDARLTVFTSPVVESPSWRDPLRRLTNLAENALSLGLYQVKSLLNIRE